ncbi:MAG: hypothetical protein DMF84_16090 [Acidobacteria bacterium]|nr:MAG: hypothetical protein DMF84_16090 [Acidobacteriota bacterium]
MRQHHATRRFLFFRIDCRDRIASLPRLSLSGARCDAFALPAQVTERESVWPVSPEGSHDADELAYQLRWLVRVVREG